MGLEGPGKLGGRPPPPAWTGSPSSPSSCFPFSLWLPFLPFQQQVTAPLRARRPQHKPYRNRLSRAVPATTGGRGGLGGESLPRGWPPPPARRPTSCYPQEKSSVSRGRGCRGRAGWASLCSSPPGMEVGGGFTRVRRGIWVSWAPAPPSGDLSLTRLPWPFPLPSLPTSRMNHLHPSPYLRAGFWGNASYGRQNDAPNIPTPRSPGTSEYVTVDDRTSSLGVIKLSTLR